MQVRATAKIRIASYPDIERTISLYSKGLKHCINIGHLNGIKNNVKLQPLVYPYLRSIGLPSQLSIACIKQACGMLKNAESRPIIKKVCVRYNFPRSASFDGKTLHLRLLHERVAFNIAIPDCYKNYFTWSLNESNLMMDKKGRCFFLFCFSKEVDTIKNSNLQSQVLGIDLGIKNLAVTSDCKFFKNPQIKREKRKYKWLRARLQAKGTRAAKRLLQKLSGREQRFMVWVNHNVSKRIVSIGTSKIVMEDLKGIREQNRGKMMNWWISNWSFYQLQSFVQYKAERQGRTFKLVNPAFTSQLCHRCGQLGSRSKGSFSCGHCGILNYSADLNAAKNLAHLMLDERQAKVNKPYLTCNEIPTTFSCIEHSQKPRILDAG